VTELWPLPDDALVPEITTVAERLRLADRGRELDQTPAFPRREFAELGRARLLGLTVPRSAGGRGLPLVRAAVALHRLAYLGGTVFAKLALQPEFCSVLGEHGSPALVRDWYLPLLAGDRLVGNQVTEPGAGSDAGALALVARPGDHGYVLDGRKSELAFAADAEAAIVYGRTSSEPGARGVSAFLVPQDLPGIRREVAPPDLGERWQRRGWVEYRSVRVAEELRLGQEGHGFEYLRRELERERGLLAAIYLGVARASWDETVRHVGERTAFGRRLADHQGVSFPIVDLGARLEAAWLFARRALGRLDDGEYGRGETAAAKALATDVALETIDRAIQFHGARGYSSALPHEQRWRDVRSGGIAHGPSEVLRHIVGRTLWPAVRPPGAAPRRPAAEARAGRRATGGGRRRPRARARR
jgi:alkylation response protein AidB-like acyl-CoA dehydrogenase